MPAKRKKTGATLGLVAVCVLVLIILGVGFFFFIKIFGGGREVANATDAGTLNVAKTAIRCQQASTPVQSDFYFLDDPDYPSRTTLLTYNRSVGQTLLVLLNAAEEKQEDKNNVMALKNAAKVLAELQTEGQALRGELTNAGSFVGDFTLLSDANDMKMSGNNPVNQADYQASMMKPGESTNIYFNSASFPDPAYAQSLHFYNDQNINLPPRDPNANPKYYMAGYKALNIDGNVIAGVPVFPQTRPHLVSLGDFNNLTFNDPPVGKWTPPNSFKVSSSSLDSKAGAFGGATACAIVGATQLQGGPAADFIACLPGGYITISNAQAANCNGLFGPADGSNSIFNNELWSGGGIQTTGAGQVEVFSLDTAQVGAWQSYNATYPANPPYRDQYGRDKRFYPPTLGYQISDMWTAPSPGAAQTSTVADLLNVNSTGTNCLDQLNGSGELSGDCNTYLPSFNKAYGRSMGTIPPLPAGQYSDMDKMKLELINAFQQGQYHTDISALPVSGMGVLKNPDGWYPFAKPSDMPLETPNGTILQMLQQIGQGEGQIVADITQRCNEIKPGTTSAYVTNTLLNVPLPMGATLYIHLQNPHNLASPLVIDNMPPATFVPTAIADGLTFTGQHVYDLLEMGIIDTLSPNGHNGADNNLHDRPFQSIDGQHITNQDGSIATDTASWTKSSGYQNLLGQLNFYQTSSGFHNFSKPN